MDAGGVLVFPNWDRVSDALARHGIRVSGDALRRGEPAAKFEMDRSRRTSTAADAEHARAYMNRVLESAGLEPSAERDNALAEIRAYHAQHNMAEHVPE